MIALIIGRVRCKFWVCGVFEVTNGRITLWRITSTCTRWSRQSSAASSGAFYPPSNRRSERVGKTNPIGAVDRARRTPATNPAADQFAATRSLRYRCCDMGELDMEPEFADETSCAAAVTISLY